MKKKKVKKPSIVDWNKFTSEQKFDWWMDSYYYKEFDEDAMNAFRNNPKINLEDARQHIIRQLNLMMLKHSLKCNCPACGKSQGFQHNSLAAGILEFGVVLVQFGHKALEKFNASHTNKLGFSDIMDNMPSFNYGDVLTHIKETVGRNPTNYGQLKHWGLIGDDTSQRNPLILGKGEFDGYKYPKEKLVKYMRNEFKLPKTVYTYNDEFHHYGKEEIYFKDTGIMKYVDRQQYRITYY